MIDRGPDSPCAKSDANRPNYKTVLTGQTVGAESDQELRTELPAGLGKTTFRDETLRPGRWTVVIGGPELAESLTKWKRSLKYP